jgi:hypothetical protein
MNAITDRMTITRAATTNQPARPLVVAMTFARFVQRPGAALTATASQVSWVSFPRIKLLRRRRRGLAVRRCWRSLVQSIGRIARCRSSSARWRRFSGPNVPFRSSADFPPAASKYTATSPPVGPLPLTWTFPSRLSAADRTCWQLGLQSLDSRRGHARASAKVKLFQ